MVRAVMAEDQKKRRKLAGRVRMSHLDDPAEAAVAVTKLEELDARLLEEKAKHREWGDGGSRKPKPDPLYTEAEQTKALAEIGPIQQALAAATAAGDIGALKDVAAMATALKAGAKARGLGIASENQASEVVLRAERAMGSLLAAVPREPGNKHLNTERVTLTPFQQALVDIGEGRTNGKHSIQPSRRALEWQQVAALSDDEFERLLDEKRRANARLAKVDFYRAVRPVSEEDKARVLAREAAKDMAETEVVASFREAAAALIEGMSQVPTDDLAEVGQIIMAVVEAYNVTYNERQGR